MTLRANKRQRTTKDKDRQCGGPSEIDLMLRSGCECSSVLPFPAPAQQTQRAEAGGEERESSGQRRRELLFNKVSSDDFAGFSKVDAIHKEVGR